MKKVLTILMCLMLVFAVGAPVFAAPPSFNLSRDSFAYAYAAWEIGSWDDPDNYVAYEVSVDNSGRNTALLCYTEYRLEYYEYEPGSGEYMWVAIDSFCQEISRDKISLTKKTVKNDMMLDVMTIRGNIHIAWTVLSSSDFRSNIIERYGQTSYHSKQRGTESICMVEGNLFGLMLDQTSTNYNVGYLIVSNYMSKQMSK